MPPSRSTGASSWSSAAPCACRAAAAPIRSGPLAAACWWRAPPTRATARPCSGWADHRPARSWHAEQTASRALDDYGGRVLRFSQVDVFSAAPLLGNPVAVVHGADALSDEQMARFARWTNLSETTFLLAPSSSEADYRLWIFTPGGELPFAGHPTLGSAHAWLEHGGASRAPDQVVQQCGAGLVVVRRRERLAFAGPPLLRSGPVDPATLDRAAAAVGLQAGDVVEAAWIDNGPGWLGLLLRDADAVRACRLDAGLAGGLMIGVVGVGPGPGPGGGADREVEVRAFCPSIGVPEDPVTGSLNAGIASWLAGSRLPLSYVATQGRALGRRGQVHVDVVDGVVWVGGDTLTTVRGEVDLG
ncbi:MAG: phenazine biosynthesis protein PhzF [Pimelobacter sp.]|nr:phenazine biosynthesis protein PhzF [Pimelobacter sp.]